MLFGRVHLPASAYYFFFSLLLLFELLWRRWNTARTHAQPATVVRKMEAQPEYCTYVACTFFFLPVWRRLACSVGAC